MTAPLTDRVDPTRLLVRAAQIGSVSSASAVGGLIRAARAAWVGGQVAASRELARTVARTLWDLGPTFVKIGQLCSTREDVLPPTLCIALRDELAFGCGHPIHRTPATGQCSVEVGSVAMVRRQSRDGVDLAVKTLHPDVSQRLVVDLALLDRVARVATVPMIRSAVPMMEIVGELVRSVRRQADLEAEAATLRRLAELEDTLPVVFPRVVDAYSDPDTLVMTWLPGQEGGRDFADRRRVARRLTQAVYEMLFITGTVHCDLHPGNWWELPDGRLAVVDAGFAYELDDEMRTHFAEFFLAMSAGNAEVCATHALAACAHPVPPEREAGFRRDIAVLIAETTGLTAGDFSLTRFAARFFAIQRRHRAWSRATFIFPFMALLAIEGQVKQLDPTINFQSLAAKVVLRAIVTRARTGSSHPPRAPLA